jgi:hypothetical protein
MAGSVDAITARRTPESLEHFVAERHPSSIVAATRSSSSTLPGLVRHGGHIGHIQTHCRDEECSLHRHWLFGRNARST